MEAEPNKRFIEYDFQGDSSADKQESDFHIYQRKIKETPEVAENYFKLATIFITRGKIADAIQMLEQCVRRDPENKEAYFLLGNGYIRHDQYEIAARYYLKALKIDANHVPALFNIGLCYAELKIQSKAINAFKKFFLLESSSRWREEAKYQLYKLGVNV